VSESKQRWRLVFARGDDARYLSHLDAVHLWERAFRRGEIPVATTEGFSPRPRLIFGAPLQLGMLAEHELADLFLSERLTRLGLVARLDAGMPSGYRLIDVHDVWVGAPALATQLAAADYRLTLLGAPPQDLGRAAAALLAAPELKREKHRDKKVVAYDLRPLVLDLRVLEADPAAAVEGFVAPDMPVAVVWMRLRNSQELGSGRPEEVVKAMGEKLGLHVLGSTGAGASQAPGAEEYEPAGGAAPVVDAAAAGRAAVRPAATPAEGAVIEIVRPVRERLWSADELAV
jgi:radical SAM-linked protein